jgi:hypothetical protein
MKLELSFSKEKKKNGYNWNQCVWDLLIQKEMALQLVLSLDTKKKHFWF